MGDVRSTVEEGIDAVPDIGLDDAQVLSFGVFLNDVAKLLDGNSWLDMFNSLL